jgi:hypothetical protein
MEHSHDDVYDWDDQGEHASMHFAEPMHFCEHATVTESETVKVCLIQAKLYWKKWSILRQNTVAQKVTPVGIVQIPYFWIPKRCTSRFLTWHTHMRG